MAFHNELGEKGEKVAVKHLINKSYLIKEQNWRFKNKEIDIISFKDDILVVVEVKTRSSDEFEKPQDAVTKKKQKFIIEATNAYIEKYNLDFDVRFDIISVLFKNNKFEIEHIEDAFQPLLR
ncbi:MAG: YraN family protein [Bacteroidales bacterium]|nr:YraN family protein [Bacteroidales bacterium]MBN2756924.1 YraN family protein [Bacteroidales bacterium]